MPSPTPPGAPRVRLRSWLLLLLSVVALVMLWVLLNLYTDGQHGWVAVVAALDVAWMLRFGGWRPGRARLLLGLAATAAVIVAAQWFIVATQIGGQLGLTPLESAAKLGVHHAWMLVRLANGPWELGYFLLALIVAVLASR